MVILPAVDCMLRDPRTRGSVREVYLLILPDLDLQRFTPVKLRAVFEPLRMSKRGAIESLRKLVEWGYLELGPPDETGVKTYRLVWACPVGSQIAPPRSA